MPIGVALTIMLAVSGAHEPALAVPFRIATAHGVLSFISTVTVFGTPLEITLSELALEAFFPADRETGAILRRIAETDARDLPRQ